MVVEVAGAGARPVSKWFVVGLDGTRAASSVVRRESAPRGRSSGQNNVRSAIRIAGLQKSVSVDEMFPHSEGNMDRPVKP